MATAERRGTLVGRASRVELPLRGCRFEVAG